MAVGGKRPLVGLLAMIIGLAFGAGTAPAAPLYGKPAGIARPLGAGAQPVPAMRRTSAAAVLSAGGSIEPGSPSPYCSADPNDPCVPPLLYGGGPVMHDVTTHVIVWDPSGYTAFPSGYLTGFQTFLADLAHDIGGSTNISSVAQQYVDASGSALQSLTNDTPITDTTSYPTTENCSVTGADACLTASQIIGEVESQISTNSLPVNWNQSYIVLLPPGVDSCWNTTQSYCEGQAFCGYHTWFSPDGSSEATFALLPYDDSTTYQYSGGTTGTCTESTTPNGVPADQETLDSIGAHELLESATDPDTSSGYLDANGWELGDECAWYYAPTSSASSSGVYNQLLNGDQYLIQDMWSNQDGACAQGDASTATATITPSASPVTSSPTSFSAAISGASASGASYAWSYVDPSGDASYDVSTAVSPQLTLPMSGTYTVWVEITDAAGGTITGVTDVTVAAAPRAAFSYTTQTPVPTPGASVSFTSTSSGYGGEAITGWSWDFGDGTTGSGTSVAHTYTAAGQYTVTLTVTESDGHRASTSVVVTVEQPPTVAFSGSPASPAPGTSVSFSSAGSAAGAGSVTAYSWSFGDGATSTEANPTHIYASAGSYTVTLTILQTDGLSASVQHTITVTAPSISTSVSTGSSASSSSTDSNATRQRREGNAWLRRLLSPSRAQLRIATLLKKGGATSVMSKAIASGRVTITWYAIVKHHRIVVARGSARVRSGHTAHIVVRLTAAGRTLLRRVRRVSLTVTGVYRYGGATSTVTRKITLRR